MTKTPIILAVSILALGLVAKRSLTHTVQGTTRRIHIDTPAEIATNRAYDEAVRLGEEAQAKGNFGTAVRQFQAAIRLRPELSFAKDDLAKVQYQEGLKAEAHITYRDLLHPNPGTLSSVQRDPRALVRYAELCEHSGDDKEARWAYAQAAHTDLAGLPPAEVVPLAEDYQSVKAAALGRAGLESASHGGNVEAAEFLQKAVQADGRSWTLRYHLGIALRNSGHPVEAETNLSRAEGLAGKNASFVRRSMHQAGVSRTLGVLNVSESTVYRPKAPKAP